jgi:hypothetical protein
LRGCAAFIPARNPISRVEFSRAFPKMDLVFRRYTRPNPSESGHEPRRQQQRRARPSRPARRPRRRSTKKSGPGVREGPPKTYPAPRTGPKEGDLLAIIDIRGLRPAQSWGGTIAPGGIAAERLPCRNCISMLSAGPRRRPESHEAYTPSLGPPQWTWQSRAALRNKSSACFRPPCAAKTLLYRAAKFLGNRSRAPSG